MATGTSSREFTLTLTDEERTQLASILEQALRAKKLEAHRTDAFEYKSFVQHQEEVLESLLAKVRD